MVAPSPAQVLAAVKASGVHLVLEGGWDALNICGWVTPNLWHPIGVVLHHTANSGAPGNSPSLGWVLHPGSLAPVRACHFLVARDGTVHLITAEGCYHAGGGGPLAVDGFTVPQDMGNAYFYGIEVESKGEDQSVTAKPTGLAADSDGMTPAQVVATTNLTAALVHLIGKNETAVIRHRDWAPGRKTDVLQPLAFWRNLIHARLQLILHPTPTPPPVLPSVSLHVVQVTAAVAGAGATASVMAQVKLVQAALNAEHMAVPALVVDGLYGSKSKAAFLAWQKHTGYAIGNGIPELASLTKLGNLHGFHTVA